MSTVLVEGRLSDFRTNPDRLIPDHLRTLVADPSKVTAKSYDVLLGDKFDDQYFPSLTAMIVEADVFARPQPTQGEAGSWGAVIDFHRHQGLRQGLLSERDRVLMLLMADEYKYSGVFIHLHVITEKLRNHGVGRAFYRHFEPQLAQMGYQYWWANHTNESIGIFERLGSYRRNQLYPEMAASLSSSTGVPGIKFLDPKLAEDWVQPQYLRPQGITVRVPST